MWIVRVALARPYTFIVLALLILILAPVVILRTPTDIFPNIDIPVIAAAFNYTGLNAEEMEERITSIYERSLTTTVNDIEHIESQSINGRAIIKVFFQPGADINAAVAQVSAISQPILRQLPPGTTPPFLLTYNASSVPILQLGLSGRGLSEQALFDYGVNFIRTRLVTIPGCAIPYPYGGKQRQIMVDINPAALQSKGLSPADVTTAIANQNLIIPAGTSKIGQFEYDVDLNSSPATVEAFNDFPIKVVNGAPIYIRDIGHVRDGFSPQTNIVRQDGRRGGAAHGDEGRQRLHAVGGGRRPQAAAGGGRHAAAGIEDAAAGRPIHLRARVHQRRDPRGGHRRLPDRVDDPAVPRQLAQHADHRDLDSALHPDVDYRAQLPARNHQHHDAGRPGAGGGHPGGRRHGGDRKHQPQPGPGQGDREGHPGRRLADRGSGAGLHALHLHRFPAHVLSQRRGALPVRAAGGSGGVRHAGLLRPLADPGARPWRSTC